MVREYVCVSVCVCVCVCVVGRDEGKTALHMHVSERIGSRVSSYGCACGRLPYDGNAFACLRGVCLADAAISSISPISLTAGYSTAVTLHLSSGITLDDGYLFAFSPFVNCSSESRVFQSAFSTPTGSSTFSRTKSGVMHVCYSDDNGNTWIAQTSVSLTVSGVCAPAFTPCEVF
jgi:hypothetical protein